MLTGAHGSGKSLVVARLASAFEQAALPSPSSRPACSSSRPATGADRTAGRRAAAHLPSRRRLYDRLALVQGPRWLECAIRQGRRLVVFFRTDADSMSAECLAQVAALANLRSAGSEHVMPVLVGTGALRLNVSVRRIGGIEDRHPSPNCGSSRPDEASGYLAQRLAAGGVDTASTFEPQAIAQLHAGGAAHPATHTTARVARPHAARSLRGRRVSTGDLTEAAASLPDASIDRGLVFVAEPPP